MTAANSFELVVFDAPSSLFSSSLPEDNGMLMLLRVSSPLLVDEGDSHFHTLFLGGIPRLEEKKKALHPKYT